LIVNKRLSPSLSRPRALALFFSFPRSSSCTLHTSLYLYPPCNSAPKKYLGSPLSNLLFPLLLLQAPPKRKSATSDRLLRIVIIMASLFLTISLSRARARARSRALSLSLARSLALSLSRALSRALPPSLPLALTRSNSLTLTLSLFLCLSPSLPPSLPLLAFRLSHTPHA
jgi:hypothetical protein